jgi:hypothetical protein
MSVYIKEIADNKVIIGGTVATDDMLDDGWKLYDGEVPCGIEFELHNGILTSVVSDQVVDACKRKIYYLLDKTAQQYDYRNMTEVSQFILSGTWKEEADALLAWQDSVWVKAYELLKEPITTVDDFVAQLPKFVSKAD